MNKLLNGAVAGAAGIALLLGGAGTFALWNDGIGLGDNQTITSGQLRFGEVPAGAWQLNGAPVPDITQVLIVPGDVLTYTLNGVEIIATGDYLHAQFGITTGTTAGDAELVAAVDKSFTVDGVDPADVSIMGTGTHNVVVTLEFDPTTGGLVAQNQSIDLSAIQLTVTQVPAPEHG